MTRLFAITFVLSLLCGCQLPVTATNVDPFPVDDASPPAVDPFEFIGTNIVADYFQAEGHDFSIGDLSVSPAEKKLLRICDFLYPGDSRIASLYLKKYRGELSANEVARLEFRIHCYFAEIAKRTALQESQGWLSGYGNVWHGGNGGFIGYDRDCPDNEYFLWNPVLGGPMRITMPASASFLRPANGQGKAWTGDGGAGGSSYDAGDAGD